MARLEKGNTIPNIELPAIDGSIYSTHTMLGRPYMLSFFRFASCPFCNLRMHTLVTRYQEFGKDFTIVGIFDSPLDNLQIHMDRHEAPFPILADAENIYYDMYGIEHSLVGVGKGILFRMPTLLRGMAKGYIPTSLKGSLLTMPADFLVNRNATIHTAHYGKDEGDHLHFDLAKEFSNQ